MYTTTYQTETRTVSGFDRVRLHSQHENELVITQAESEALTIEAPEDVLRRIRSEVRHGRLTIELNGGLAEKIADALTTSLSRPRIRYHLAVKDLRELAVFAVATVEITRLATPELALNISGVADVRIDSLTAERLSIDFRGPGRVEIAGQVVEQQVDLFGPGQYFAHDLASCRAKVSLRGMGQAQVWAEDSLEVRVDGPGGVSYRGRPQLKQHVSPIGYVTRASPG